MLPTQHDPTIGPGERACFEDLGAIACTLAVRQQGADETTRTFSLGAEFNLAAQLIHVGTYDTATCCLKNPAARRIFVFVNRTAVTSISPFPLPVTSSTMIVTPFHIGCT